MSWLALLDAVPCHFGLLCKSVGGLDLQLVANLHRETPNREHSDLSSEKQSVLRKRSYVNKENQGRCEVVPCRY